MDDEIVLQGKPNKYKPLIEQLGLNDRDKLNPRHDLAVRYVQLKAEKLAEMLGWKKATLEPEVRLTRRDVRGGSSGFIVGFADGLLFAQSDLACVDLDGHPVPCARNNCAVVEVKITREPIGNCLRQLHTYLGAHEIQYYGKKLGEIGAFLVLDYPITEAEQMLCKSAKITLLRLGPEFDRFVLDQQASAAKVVEL